VKCNSFTKFYLALLGQFPTPTVRPSRGDDVVPALGILQHLRHVELDRTIVLPLSIFFAYKPVRTLTPEQGIRELFLEASETPLWTHPPTSGWSAGPTSSLG